MFKKGGESFDERGGVRRARGLKGRVHRQLRETDVHGVERYLRVGDVAERRAARHVGAVGVILHRHAGALADAAEDAGGNGVGGVALVGVVFDDNTAVHARGVVAVGKFAVVGVDGVRVVAGDEKAARHETAVFAAVHAERGAQPRERVIKESGCRALLRLAADLFVIEDAADGNGAALPGGEKRRQRGESALEIVQPRRGDVFPERDALLRIVKEKIAGDDGVLRNTGGLGDGGAEAALFAAHPYGQHIDGGIVLHAVVGVAVHVDGDVRDDGAGVLEIHELHRKLVALGYENTARHGKRPVEPRGAEHPAVFLHGETEIIPVRKLRVLLDLERRAVAVRGGHHKARDLTGGDAKRDEGRAIPRDKILAAGNDLPALRLAKLGISGLAQHVRAVGAGVERRGTYGDIIKELFVHVVSFPSSGLCRNSTSFSSGKSTAVCTTPAPNEASVRERGAMRLDAIAATIAPCIHVAKRMSAKRITRYTANPARVPLPRNVVFMLIK